SKLYSFTFPELYWHSNSDQIQMIGELEKVLKGSEDPLIFDGMGVLPRFRNVYIYLEPILQKDSQEIVELIRLQKPDVVLWNNRSFILYPFLAVYLDSEFIEIS